MNSGMGVSEKLSTAALLLRTSWCRPASPPRNSTAPMRLMAMKENATGMPTNSRIVEPPSRSREAICQDIVSDLSDLSRRRNGVVSRAPFGCRQPLHAKAELEREQREGHGHRGEQPPFRQHQRLDGDRPVDEARSRDSHAVPHKDQAADETDHVANPLRKPAEAPRHGAQHDIDADVASLAQQAGGR